MIGSWPGPAGEEYAVTFDRGRTHRLLVLPALFDESNKLRHFTVEVMRQLDTLGVDSFLPDLPGCNESTVPLNTQDLHSLSSAANAASAHFRATRVLAIRGGSLLAPEGIAGWAYAPASGRSLLSTMLRAQVLNAREAGQNVTREGLLERGRSEGLALAGYRLNGAMIGQLEAAQPADHLDGIPQGEIGGAGLWLRAEPDHDADQAKALADLVLAGFGA